MRTQPFRTPLPWSLGFAQILTYPETKKADEWVFLKFGAACPHAKPLPLSNATMHQNTRDTASIVQNVVNGPAFHCSCWKGAVGEGRDGSKMLPLLAVPMGLLPLPALVVPAWCLQLLASICLSPLDLFYPSSVVDATLSHCLVHFVLSGFH